MPIEERPSVTFTITIELPPEYTGHDTERVEVTRSTPVIALQHGQLDFRTALKARLTSVIDELLDEVPLPYWIEPW